MLPPSTGMLEDSSSDFENASFVQRPAELMATELPRVISRKAVNETVPPGAEMPCMTVKLPVPLGGFPSFAVKLSVDLGSNDK